MTNIEFVKGILITPEGKEYPFGTHSYEEGNRNNPVNCHDPAFKEDIVSKPWFEELIKDIGFEYSGDTVHREVIGLAAKGVISVINGSDTNLKGEEYNIYCIHTPKNLTDSQKEILEKSYEGMKELIERKNAYFEADSYDENKNYLWEEFVCDLDDFYDRMNLNRIEEKGKGR